MSARFHLNLIGYPELLTESGARIELKTKKHLALVIVLAVERRRIYSRDWLIDLLWEGAAPERGRQSLSMALSDLRKALGDGIVDDSRHAELCFAREAIRLDVRDLARWSTPAQVAPLFGDFSLRQAGNFERWMDGIKADYLPKVLHCAVCQLMEARRGGDLQRTAELAGSLLRLSEFSEDGILARVESLAALGDRWAALEAWERWSERVRQELGREPSQGLACEVVRILFDAYKHRSLLREDRALIIIDGGR